MGERYDPDRESTAKLRAPDDEGEEAGNRKVTPYLLVISGTAIGRMYRLVGDGITLGRSLDADVVIDDEGVSRKHAEVRAEGEDVILEDLGSTNGIFVNGKRKGRKKLKDGDRLRIGSTILKLSYQDELEETFQRRLYDSAVRDPLTSAYNKRFFSDSIRTEFAYCSRQGTPMAILMLDMDFFKDVNDTFGHQAGDYVLRTVAALITETLSTEDLLCRYGGEEFSVLLKGEEPGGAETVANRIRELIADHRFVHEGTEIEVTASIGVACLHSGTYEGVGALVRAADDALYEAKNGGRNQVRVAN